VFYFCSQDWRRAGGGALASATAHSGAVTAVTPLRHDRADVAASAGVDGVVRVLSLDGGSGGGVALVGHLAPVTGLVRVGGFGEFVGEFETGSNGSDSKAGHGRRLSSIADLTGPHRGRGVGGDASGMYGRNGAISHAGTTSEFEAFNAASGLASASADGTVRLWCPHGAGARWRCAAVAHAHASRVVAMARCSGGGSGGSGGGSGTSSGGLFRGRLLTAGDDASFARWPDAEPFLRRARVGGGSYAPVESSAGYRRVGGSNPGGAGGGGAAWTPERMHHKPYRAPRVVCAIDVCGAGALVTGTRDGVVTCASLE